MAWEQLPGKSKLYSESRSSVNTEVTKLNELIWQAKFRSCPP